MKDVCVCAIVKGENRYIRDWVNYYINTLKVDKIFLYDNNEPNGECLLDELGDYVDYNVVEITNWSYKTNIERQMEAYDDCYSKHNNEYQWFCFFDIDEYMYIQDSPINQSLGDYLKQDRFKEFDLIHVVWKIYGDSEHIYYEDKPCIERFIDQSKNQENCHVKSILRGGINGVWFTNPDRQNPHTIYNKQLNTCFTNGRKKKQEKVNSFINPTSLWGDAYLKHFISKTIDEWLNVRMKRGNCSRVAKIEEFFDYNKRTQEKEEFIEKWKKSNLK